MTTNNNEKTKKNEKKYLCQKCNFKSCKKTDYARHLLTAKHIKTTNNNEKTKKNTELLKCVICEKIFNDRSGLWRHNKKCVNKIENKEQIFDKEFVMNILKTNNELQTQIVEILKTGSHNSHNTIIKNNNNNNNKTFNLQFFLNETCKDAMNIMDFVETIKIQLSDLIKVGEIGYVEGISNIINTNLKLLDVTQRPIHCTDKKRETLYVKDEDKWEKDEDKNKIKKVIKNVAFKNIKTIPQFKEKYPDCQNSDSKFSDQYNYLIIEAMGGPGDNIIEKEENIIKNISKQIIIEKE